MTEPQATPREKLQRELIELVATAMHEFAPPALMLIVPNDNRPEWQRRLGSDEKFKAAVLQLVSGTAMIVNDSLKDAEDRGAIPLAQLVVMLGHWQDGSDTPVRFSQDDACREYVVSVGNDNPGRHYSDSHLPSAIAKAFEAETKINEPTIKLVLPS